MNGSKPGLWDIIDQALRSIGKGTAWLVMRRFPRGEESAGYALLGGAVVCTIAGGLTGFGLSNHAQDLAMAEGAIIGSLLGACAGIFFGSFVEAVDDTINAFLRSLSSK